MTETGTASQAHDKRLLLKRVREGSLAADAAIALLRKPLPAGAAGVPWEQQFMGDLSGLIGKLLHCPPDKIDLDAPVADMGLDSLSATEFSNHVRIRWGLSLSATAFFECNTVREFQQYMVRIHGNALRGHYSPDSAALAAMSSPASAGPAAPAPAAEAEADAGSAPPREAPLRTVLQRLWQQAEQDLAPAPAAPRLAAGMQRLLIERAGRPAIEVCQGGRGEPVLLLGGLMNPDTIWHRQVQALCAAARVVTFNKPGCGRSGVDVQRLTIGSIVEDILDALDALNIDAPLRVVGFSFGGLLAQALALHQPGRIARLALINSTACARPQPDDIQILKDELARCPEVIALNGEINFALSACYREVSGQFDMREALPSLRLPALVLSAAQDRYMRPDKGRELARLLPGARHVELAGAGHFSLLTHAEEINTHLLGFLRLAKLPAERAHAVAA